MSTTTAFSMPECRTYFQIVELKKALENMNKQYNQLKVGAEGLLHENEDLKDRLNKREMDWKNATSRTKDLEDEIRNLVNKMSRAEDEHRKTQEQLRVRPSTTYLRAPPDDCMLMFYCGFEPWPCRS